MTAFFKPQKQLTPVVSCTSAEGRFRGIQAKYSKEDTKYQWNTRTTTKQSMGWKHLYRHHVYRPMYEEV